MKSLAHPAHPSTRKERGEGLYAEYAEEIRYDAKHGVWLVPSQSEGTSLYEVTLGLHPSCECKDFDYNGHREPCKHIRCARLVEANRISEDLPIDYPLKEELLATCEYALGWFEDWETHANHEYDFGGEHATMKKLRRALRLAREEA